MDISYTGVNCCVQYVCNHPLHCEKSIFIHTGRVSNLVVHSINKLLPLHNNTTIQDIACKMLLLMIAQMPSQTCFIINLYKGKRMWGPT